ncbi:hypothetical protein DACRYDRAFT_17674 [Dacryopinax primogenitus]|uniref:Integrase core domain-containing protein n=1 Tax=Dacryopinax primogenitus (strain DJM 731) TaxID=1858805 RepID=M5FQ64_DACPD|nr:uncharacterized protein DACRYDRAFT_17674 [Dacryopinax primogenitus]EJT98990.1 hypothetical protein DACRYDRAFT_17674 [Dacryopinax primogenitus]
MWVNVTNLFGQKWALFFLDLEANEGLNCHNNNHLWLLHWLFLQDINNNATRFQNEWNFHTMSLAEGNQHPVDLFLKGCLQHGARGIQLVTGNDQHYYANLGSYGSEVNITLAEAEEDQPEVTISHAETEVQSLPNAHLQPLPAQGFIHTHGITDQMPACLSNIDLLPPDLSFVSRAYGAASE